MADIFTKEDEFEEAVIASLQTHGWTGGVLKHPSEQDLLDNWAQILFENNKGIDRLNGCPLTAGEKQQLLDQVNALKSPVRLNEFINAGSVAIKRDNKDDALHFGKEVSLYIYDRLDIAAGRSRYQIAQQPHIRARKSVLPNRRGDLMLLINGMPLIHLELKRSGVQVSQAANQIQKYAHEGVFTGIYALVQVFVAMEPNETLYFANPGTAGSFNEKFFFHWADFNNEPISDWKQITKLLLSIPMAHQLIGFYTVADRSDGILKVMRSYQYYAAARISDRVRMAKWGEKDTLGGHVWHTTGSGKTLTSFKSAQLIADSHDADKVVFLMDRIELGTQSLQEYRNFAHDALSVQSTENTAVLKERLKSNDPSDTLIVTSIQKMSLIHGEDDGLDDHDLEVIRSKRMVFIVDECHRSTFGDMMQQIKHTFPNAMLFGFTGTPVFDENQKKMNTTTDVFGSELHRYSIADGIRDENVLGFDPYKVCTYKDKDVRQAVALDKAKASSVTEAMNDPAKKETFNHYMDAAHVPMAGYRNADGTWEKGIEDYLPESQYSGIDGTGNSEHLQKVVEDICEGWAALSQGGKYHALLATHSIPEAISYYRLFKSKAPWLAVTALFDPNIDNGGGVEFKEDGLIEILKDYNESFGKTYSMSTHAMFKKDVAARLAHKNHYSGIARKPQEQINLLIVVDQMLTGFDSKWINTLYLDKVLRFELLIQAFSRTNRLAGEDKPFGTIRYYRRPHTMEKNIEAAVELYSGDKPQGLFSLKLPQNLEAMNDLYDQIEKLFLAAGILHFEKLPDSQEACAKFAKLFKELNDYLEASKVQGFVWEKLAYEFEAGDGSKIEVALAFDENDYLVLAKRYKELFSPGGGSGPADVPYDIVGYLTEIDTGRIDHGYMQENFQKWLKRLAAGGASQEELDSLLETLHASFASLDQEQQHFADVVLHDIQNGELSVVPGKSFMDYITEYQSKAKKSQVASIVAALGVDRAQLEKLMGLGVTEETINEYGRFDALKASADMAKAREYFAKLSGAPLPPPLVAIKLDGLLRKFIFAGGFEIE